MADRVASLHLVRKLAALLRFLKLFHQRQNVLRQNVLSGVPRQL